MRYLTFFFLIVAFLALSINVVEAKTAARWRHNVLEYYDTATGKPTITAIAPYYFEEEFLGAYFRKYTAAENTTALWKTVETSLNAAMALSADGVPGLLSAAFDADNNAERAVLYFGDNECLSIDDGVIFETRIRYSVAPTGYTTIVVGLAGADNADPDAIDTNVWVRVSHADNDAFYWESDDGTTDNDDQDCSVAMATASYYIIRIDAFDEDSVKIYINGNLVGTADMSALTSTTGKVQPYIALDKSGGTGLGTVLIDYVKVWGWR